MYVIKYNFKYDILFELKERIYDKNMKNTEIWNMKRQKKDNYIIDWLTNKYSKKILVLVHAFK